MLTTPPKIEDNDNEALSAHASLDSLNPEHRVFYRVSAFSWIHWLIVASSLLMTAAAWYFSSSAISAKSKARFDKQHERIVHLLSERLEKYEDALWGGAAASKAQGPVFSREKWRQYARFLDIDTRYPGINGIGIIEPVQRNQLDSYLDQLQRKTPDFNVHPEHEQEEHLVISQIEPLELNRAALGLDIAFEKNRREGARRSRDSGDAIITAPIVLVQDEKQTPGFLFFAPVFSAPDLQDTSKRRESLQHWVYAPFVMSRLIKGVLDQQHRDIFIRISDNNQELYSECCGEATGASRNNSRSVSLSVYGRQWTVEAWPSPAFYKGTESSQPVMILIAGLTVDAMLFALFIVLTRSNRRAVDLADKLSIASDHLSHKTKALERSNKELESFAYIASHDLKSPLRGIQDLAHVLEQDMRETSPPAGIDPVLADRLQRIRCLAERMRHLIDGVLNYSTVGKRTGTLESVNVEALLEEISEDLQLTETQLTWEGSLPVFETSLIQLKQVLSNLLSNAIKHHPDPAIACVTVSVQSYADCFKFTIADNGPGIDPRFHSRIFEVFQTLQVNEDVESTGIGLAIVKKTVEALGGKITLVSAIGAGTTFHFTWPKYASDLSG